MLTDTVTTAPPGLIDHAAVAAADAARDAALARAHRARIDHAQAEASLAAANLAADAVAASGGDLHAAQDRIDATERAAKISARVLAAAEAAAAQAPAIHRAAVGAAHRNAAMAAAHARLAACRRGEAARAELALAEQDFIAATASLAGCRAAGFSVLGATEVLSATWPRTEADELRAWAVHYTDLKTNKFHGEG